MARDSVSLMTTTRSLRISERPEDPWSAMAILVVYLVLIAIGLLGAFMRHETSLVRGAGVLKLTVAFAGAAIIAALFAPALGRPSVFVLIGLAALLVPLRDHWLLVKPEPARIMETIERCCNGVLLECARVDGGVRLGTRGPAVIRVRHAKAVGLLVFHGSSRCAKAGVLKDLMVKQFAGAFPRLVIRLKEDPPCPESPSP